MTNELNDLGLNAQSQAELDRIAEEHDAMEIFVPNEPYTRVFLTKTQIEILINLLRQEVLHMVTITVPESEIEPLRDLHMVLEMVSSEME